MNYYFLLEDEKSFLKVLPLWLQYLGFGCERVADIKDVRQNNYVLQSGQGVTQLVTKVLYDTIDTIIQNPGKIDKLVVILDAEDMWVEDRKKQVYEKIGERYSEELDFDITILVCNHCFETWLLGCCGIYPTQKVEEDSFFYAYYNHYNIEMDNPEKMQVPIGCNDSIAKYHFHYLHELLRYKRIRYSKNKPQNIATESFLDGIIKRINNTEHLESFHTFYNFIMEEKVR